VAGTGSGLTPSAAGVGGAAAEARAGPLDESAKLAFIVAK
jgi:hypothetical protein